MLLAASIGVLDTNAPGWRSSLHIDHICACAASDIWRYDSGRWQTVIYLPKGFRPLRASHLADFIWPLSIEGISNIAGHLHSITSSEMTSGDIDKSVTGRRCTKCGQLFERSISFCPHDGTQLGQEIHVYDSKQLVEIRHGKEKLFELAGQATAEHADDRTVNVSLSAAQADLDTPVAPLIGTILDNQYEILSVAGQGGMSIVYRARHVVMDRTVAIKTLLPHLVVHPNSKKRFMQEAKAASNLNHPNVVAIHGFGESNRQPYIVMDYIEGTSLYSLIKDGQAVTPALACHIFEQIADALALTHSQGIIHRDLKPSNILLTRHGSDDYFVKIVDFGIAKLLPHEGNEVAALTQTGEVFGSPLYMSPEQCRGQTLDARSDVYSMGCLMYETLSGSPVFSGENTLELIYRQTNAVPEPFSRHGVAIPQQLERIVFRALAKEPIQRYQSMEKLCADLRDLSHQQSSGWLAAKDRWELFCLRRKPKTAGEKLALALAFMAIIMGPALGLAIWAGYTYWRGSEVPANVLVLDWLENPSRNKSKTSAPSINDSNEVLIARLENICKRALAHPETVDDPQGTIADLIGLGQRAANSGNFALAARAYQAALNLSIRVNGEDTVPTLHIVTKLADSFSAKGDYNLSARYWSHLVELCQAAHWQGELEVCNDRAGSAYYLAEQYEQALRYFQQALLSSQTARRTLKSESLFIPPIFDPSTKHVLLLSRMGDCYRVLAQESIADRENLLKKAAAYYKTAVTDWTLLRGSYNQNEVVARLKLAQVEHQLAQGKTTTTPQYQAETSIDYEQAVAHARKTFPPNSTALATVLRDYAQFLSERHNLWGALTAQLEYRSILASFSHRSL